jgi:type VI secretion system secreted protein Hcp
MAVTAYLNFIRYDNSTLTSELQNTVHPGWTEVSDYSFDIEQVLNIGSQSAGAGAGKVTFNPFSITRNVDVNSPIFYQMCCSGTPFKSVDLALHKAGTPAGPSGAPQDYLTFTFKLVAVRTISWTQGAEGPGELITFEYGGLDITYYKQNANGSYAATPAFAGWNRVKNVADTSAAAIL